MVNLICKSCGFIQNDHSEDSKDKKNCSCKHCGSANMYTKSVVIKLYFECLSCKKFFKIGEPTSKQLMIRHKNPECPFCKSEHTHTSHKNFYKKFSGQAKRIVNSKIVTLFEV